ncbi:hypothetical protein HYT00_02350 [Candidatus Giovannonibacteria bacterium]|nr:hypothetical protein [Candidatus Giovannonibacteria bacterium]
MGFLSALLFYLAFSLFGLIGFPIISRLTANRFLALGASKLTGLAIFSYIIWLLSSLKILDYQNRGIIFGLFFILIFTGAFFMWKYPTESFQVKNKNNKKDKKNRGARREYLKEILIIEGISIAIYLLYLLLRSYNPGANNTEHFMDMAFLSASGKTHFFPFIDPWFSEKLVNYYYYGSYIVSLLSNLSFSPYALSYNFALGLIYAESIILSGVLVYAITGLKRLAALASFLVTSAGTLFYAACTLKGAFANPATVCSYASSTRLYTPSYIINEIPSYSFTVGNLHAHLIALPFFLLFLILLYNVALQDKPRLRDFSLIALTLAVSGMINAWDFITGASLLGALILYKLFSKKEILNIGKWLLAGAATLLGSAILALPYILHFTSPVLGLGFAPAYVKLHNLSNTQYPTPFAAILGMWGIFIMGIIFWLLIKKKKPVNFSFLFALGLVSFGILVGVELFFIKDIYSIANPPYFRANTTFKFGYHAWTMFSILFSILMASFFQYFFSWQKYISYLAKASLIIALIAGAFYPYQAINQYYTGRDPLDLDGSVWINKTMPDDYQAIQYINRTFKDRVVIAEAIGDSYTNYARITAFTGMITPMGWKSHEWTWRFNGKDAANARVGEQVETGWGAVSLVAEDISILYQTSDELAAKKIIEKYEIKYLYIGGLEREAYPTLNEEKFLKLGKVVFESRGAKLFSLN